MTSFSALWLANEVFLSWWFSTSSQSHQSIFKDQIYSNFWEVDSPISPASSTSLLPNVISPPILLELPKAKGVECVEAKGFVWLSFFWSFNQFRNKCDISLHSPLTGPMCVDQASGAILEYFPTIGKELSCYENSREVQRKRAGFSVPLWWEPGKRRFSSSCGFLQIPFKGGQSS